MIKEIQKIKDHIEYVLEYNIVDNNKKMGYKPYILPNIYAHEFIDYVVRNNTPEFKELIKWCKTKGVKLYVKRTIINHREYYKIGIVKRYKSLFTIDMMHSLIYPISLKTIVFYVLIFSIMTAMILYIFGMYMY